MREGQGREEKGNLMTVRIELAKEVKLPTKCQPLQPKARLRSVIRSLPCYLEDSGQSWGRSRTATAPTCQSRLTKQHAHIQTLPKA